MTKIYGYSDDLIEVESQVLNAELNPIDDSGYLVLSDGTVLKYKYDDDGIWRFKVKTTHTTGVKIISFGTPESTARDSDEVEIPKDVVWAVIGNQFEGVRRPSTV